MVAWASRIFDLGASETHPEGRSKWMPALPAAGPLGGALGAPASGTAVPREEMVPTAESGAAGAAASVAAGAAAGTAWASRAGYDSWEPPQAAKPSRRKGSR